MAGEESLIIAMIFSTGFLFFGIAFLLKMSSEHKRDKTYNYRKNLTDLIVVGKLRQYAEKAKVNLKEEKEFFKDFIKEDRIKKQKPMDEIIEEKIEEDIQKS